MIVPAPNVVCEVRQHGEAATGWEPTAHARGRPSLYSRLADRPVRGGGERLLASAGISGLRILSIEAEAAIPGPSTPTRATISTVALPTSAACRSVPARGP